MLLYRKPATGTEVTDYYMLWMNAKCFFNSVGLKPLLNEVNSPADASDFLYYFIERAR